MDWRLSLHTSGRYHKGLDLFPSDQVWPALYTSLAPEVSLWEMVRRSAARNLNFLNNNVLSELAVDLSHLLDLTDPPPATPALAAMVGQDHRFCQALAAAAIKRGCAGLLVPSAALPGTNLVIFPQNLPEPLPLRVVRSVELPLDSPRP